MSQGGQAQGKIAQTLVESVPLHLFTCDLQAIFPRVTHTSLWKFYIPSPAMQVCSKVLLRGVVQQHSEPIHPHQASFPLTSSLGSHTKHLSITPKDNVPLLQGLAGRHSGYLSVGNLQIAHRPNLPLKSTLSIVFQNVCVIKLCKGQPLNRNSLSW